MKNTLYQLNSKSYGLMLLLLIFLTLSCEKVDKKTNAKICLKGGEKDSITVSVKLNGKTKVELNYRNKYLDNEVLVFNNLENDSVVIQKKIAKKFVKTILTYSVLVYNNGNLKPIEQVFVIDKSNDKLKLVYNNDKYLFEENANYINRLNLAYKKLQTDFYKNQSKKDVFRKELDSLYKALKLDKKVQETSGENNLNDLYYYYLLEIINSSNENVDEYLTKNNISIASKYLAMLLYNYTKNRIHQFDYKTIDFTGNENHLNMLALGHFYFLKHEDNIGDKKYQPAVNWFKTTKFYKKDSIFIKKEITPLNNSKFKEKLRELNLFNTSFVENKFEIIIKKLPSSYYLIDFWATWCAPCIQGIHKINEMDLPKNVKIISISLDKEKDKEKWKTKTKELAQPYTYWLNENSITVKSFLKFIELHSIPRYILIDKNMNLIDQAFLHPNEPQFLTKLKDVKNSKYW